MPAPIASATTSDCNVKELQDLSAEAEYTWQSPSASMSNMNVQPAAETPERLRTASIGSHEVSLIFDFDNQKLFKNVQTRRSNKRKYRCPTDFKGYD